MFKPTANRRFTVSPTGLPDFSGFQQAANLFGTLAQEAYSVGTDARKRQFNKAILQAEADGKTAGVQYDENNNLIPLTNLDYIKAADQLAPAERDAVLNTYKKSAISTYAFAHGLDAKDAADKAFLQFSSDPDGIDTSMNAYMSSIQKLDNNIASAVMPKAMAHFKTARNKAVANQRLEQIKSQTQTNLNAFNANVQELGVLFSKIGPTPESGDEKTAGILSRIEEIEDENDQIFLNLQANDYSDADLEKLNSFKEGAVLTRTYQSHLERSMASHGSDVRLFREVGEIIESVRLSGNENIDPDKLATVLYATADRSRQLKNMEIAEAGKLRDSVYHDLYAKVNMLDVPLSEIINNPSSGWELLSGTQQTTIFGIDLESQEKDTISAYQDNLSTINSYERNNKSLEGIQAGNNAINAIREAYSNQEPGMSLKLLNEANDAYDKAVNDRIINGPESGQRLAADIVGMINDPNFTVSPDVLMANLDVFEERLALEKGSGFAANRASAVKKISDYAKKYDEYHNVQSALPSAVNALMAGAALTTTQQKAIKTLEPTTVQIGGEKFKVDPLNQNQQIADASLGSIMNYSMTYNYRLPEIAKNILNETSMSEQNANLYNQIIGELALTKAKKEGISVKEARLEIEISNELDQDSVMFMRSFARTASFSDALAAYNLAKGDNINRFLSEIDADLPSNLSQSEKATAHMQGVFDRVFAHARTPFEKFAMGGIMGNLSKERQKLLEEVAEASGFTIPQLRNAYLGNPEVLEIMKAHYFRVLKHNGKDGEIAQNDAFMEALKIMGTRFGFEETYDNGRLTIRLTERPAAAQLQAQVPKRFDLTTLQQIQDNLGILDRETKYVIDPLTGDKKKQLVVGDPVIRVNNSMLGVIWKNSWLARNPAWDNEEDLRAINEIGPKSYIALSPYSIAGSTVQFNANPSFGGDKTTYQVVVINNEGHHKVMEQAWTPSWEQTEAQTQYFNAVESMKTSRIKKLANVGGLFTPTLLQGIFENRMDAAGGYAFRNFMDTAQSIVFAAGSTLKDYDPDMFDIDANPLTQDEITDLISLAKTIKSLGLY